MLYLLKIFFVGSCVLVAAIVINFVAVFFGVSTWYDFILDINKNGLRNALIFNFYSLPFLFFIYPLILGLVSRYFFKKIGL